MTEPKTDELNDGELNLFIASLMDWQVSLVKKEPCIIPVLFKGRDAYVNFQLPDYVNSLDEMHKVELMLLQSEKYVRAFCNYPAILFEVVTGKRFDGDGVWFECINASARQKALAVYRAIKLQEEEPPYITEAWKRTEKYFRR